MRGLFLMTFEELLEKVKSAKNLRRSHYESTATFLREGFISDEFVFGWLVVHPAKGFEKHERYIGGGMARTDDDESIEIIKLMPNELFMFREALAMNADFFEVEETKQEQKQ